MIILFSVLSGLCSFLWYTLLADLLESVSIVPVRLEHPLHTHAYLAGAYCIASSTLYLVFSFVEWYQQNSISTRAKLFAFLAAFLGLNLGVLLRCILFFRTEIAESSIYSSAQAFPLDGLGLEYWGFGGAQSTVVIVLAILTTLSILQSP